MLSKLKDSNLKETCLLFKTTYIGEDRTGNGATRLLLPNYSESGGRGDPTLGPADA